MNLKKLLTANAPRKLSDNIQDFNKHPGRRFVALLFVASLVFSDLAVFAQSGQNPQATPAPVQETQDAPKIPNEQLDSLVAPIALYPDPLLSQVLVASTYPLELIQLQQWLHKTGQYMNENARAEAVKQEDWDPSIQAIPIVKRSGKWYLDARSGRKEILDRRIGANELDALTICRGYAEVQKEYALQAHDGVNQYAQRIISTPGKRDGLAWKNEDGSWGGPVGEGIAKALQQGYTSKAEPYHGYYFKILKGQGPAAPLGKMDFVVKGMMIGGFTLIAVPAEYRVTGVKTFIVSYEDIVYEKDLGLDSLNIVKKMELYNPDRTWRRTDDAW